MDEKTAEILSVFSSVLRQESPLKYGVSPQHFRYHAVKALSSIDESFNICRGNQDLVEVMTLSAITGLYHYLWMSGQPSSQTNVGKKTNATQSEPTVLGAFNANDSVQMWYNETIEEMTANNSTLLMVNILSKCDSKFAKFLARKALLTGLKSGKIEVRSVLDCIEVQISSTECLSSSVVELLKDTMSQNMQREEARNNFFWLKQKNILAVLSNFAFTTHCTSLIVYFIFIKKLVKLGVKLLPSEDNIEFIGPLFIQYIFPVLNKNFQDSDRYVKLTVFSQYLKAVNIFIVSNWVTSANSAPKSAIKVIQGIHSFAPFLLEMLDDCGAIHNSNFIGKLVQNSSDNNRNSSNQPCSSLLRHAVGIILKSCAVLMQGTERSEDLLLLLQPFFRAILMTERASLKFDTVTSATGWLEAHFGDQDNHWISILCSLLIIHRKIKQNNKHQLGTASTLLRSFLFLFEPHQLFLHFAHFVDYDHLVFSDFLISPETNFLTYFLHYIHYIAEDWENFVSSIKINKVSTQSDCFFVTVGSFLSETFPQTEGRQTLNTDLVRQHAVDSNIKSSLASLVCYSDTDSDDQPVPCKVKRTSLSPPTFFSASRITNEKCCEQSFSNESVSEDVKDSHMHNSIGSCPINSNMPSCLVQGRLDRVMGLIIRLRMHISRLEKRGIFPYKIKPLIRVLETCEELYETT